jgi:uncharacterized protein
MPRFALTCLDKPGHLPLRQQVRPDHLAYVKETGAVDQGGPLLNAAGEMVGSMIVLDLPDLAAAQAWSAGDPYAKAGLFAQVHMHEWKKAVR